MLHLDALDAIERDSLRPKEADLREGLEKLNKCFATKVAPENGGYGVSEIIKDNGVVERLGKNELGHTFKEYYSDGKLYMKREALGSGKNITTHFDDNGTAYFQTKAELGKNQVKKITWDLIPNTTVRKGNFSAVIDEYGRPTLNKVTDLQLNSASRGDIRDLKDHSYKKNDQRGHLIAHQFGGPESKENIVAQLDEVNLKRMKAVESIVNDLKQQGHRVDYEVKSNYIGTSKRPSSFEPKIIKDGKEYTELPNELRKILNKHDDSAVGKAITAAGERFGLSHELGVKSGLVAVGIALPASIVENVSAFAGGEISAEELASEIISNAAKAGGLAYGTDFAATSIVGVLSRSSSELVKRVGNTCFPGAVAVFAVESHKHISDFVKGEIDATELIYNLGETAASIGGSFAGGGLMGAMVGSVAGPVGSVVGSLIGGVIGCAIASDLYEAAVNAAEQGAELIAEKMNNLKEDIIELVTEYMPEKLDAVTSAFRAFFEENAIPSQV